MILPETEWKLYVLVTIPALEVHQEDQGKLSVKNVMSESMHAGWIGTERLDESLRGRWIWSGWI